MTVKDFVSKKIKVTQLENIEPEADMNGVMNLLRDKNPDLVKKGHYSLLFVDGQGKKYILKNKDVLAKLKV